jgi:hypothetical protein
MRQGISDSFSRIFRYATAKQVGSAKQRDNGHAVPDSDSPSQAPGLPGAPALAAAALPDASTDSVVERMAGLIDRLKEDDRNSLLSMAERLAHEERGELGEAAPPAPKK